MWTRTEVRTQFPNLESLVSHSDFLLGKGSYQSLFSSESPLSVSLSIQPCPVNNFLYSPQLPSYPLPMGLSTKKVLSVFHGSMQFIYSCGTAGAMFHNIVLLPPRILKLYGTTNVEHLQLKRVLSSIRSGLGTSVSSYCGNDIFRSRTCTLDPAWVLHYSFIPSCLGKKKRKTNTASSLSHKSFSHHRRLYMLANKESAIVWPTKPHTWHLLLSRNTNPSFFLPQFDARPRDLKKYY